jgi:CRP-like cAMP-binding protein
MAGCGAGPDAMTTDLSELETELDRLASSISLPAGAVLFHCGDPASGVFLVRKGTVRMALDDAEGIFPQRLIGPGEILGLPAALTGHYSLSATVIEPAELGYVPAPLVNSLLECSPRLCLLATRVMSAEIARMRSALRDGVHVAVHE